MIKSIKNKWGKSMGFLVLFASLFSVSVILLSACKKKDSDTPKPLGASINLNQFHFRASHNSYSGNQADGYRGSITQQLDAGLRMVEFDIHYDSDNDKIHLGHLSPGAQVEHGFGNPGSTELQHWISRIVRWSRLDSIDEPVFLTLDMRTPPEFTAPRLVRLNQILTDSFGDRILRPRDFNPSTFPIAIAGRILIILSGNLNSRKTYAGFTGDSAVAFVEHQKDDGQLGNEYFYAAESSNCSWAHQSINSGKFVRLWDVTNNDCQNPAPNLPATNTPYFGWYGSYAKEFDAIPSFDFKSLVWKTEHTHQFGLYPDVGINNAGYVVEVHQSQNNINELWYNTGQISADSSSITWLLESKNPRQYDTGENPTVAINDHGIVVEIHGSENNDNLYYNVGKLNKTTGKIQWLHKSHYDDGDFPSVALNQDNSVVEVHSGSDLDLWYNVGVVDTATGIISWGSMTGDRKYAQGKYPTVAVYQNQIFEVHEGFTMMGWIERLWSMIGYINTATKKIIWKTPGNENIYPYPIDESGGTNPSVAMFSGGALEVHRTISGIWWRSGTTYNTLMVLGQTLRVPNPTSNSRSFVKISIDANDRNLAVLYFNAWYEELHYRVATYH